MFVFFFTGHCVKLDGVFAQCKPPPHKATEFDAKSVLKKLLQDEIEMKIKDASNKEHISQYTLLSALNYQCDRLKKASEILGYRYDAPKPTSLQESPKRSRKEQNHSPRGARKKRRNTIENANVGPKDNYIVVPNKIVIGTINIYVIYVTNTKNKAIKKTL